MKIIKKGRIEKVKRTKRFQCHECGCVFEADQGEYEEAETQWDIAGAVCPCCNHTALEIKMRGV